MILPTPADLQTSDFHTKFLPNFPILQLLVKSVSPDQVSLCLTNNLLQTEILLSEVTTASIWNCAPTPTSTTPFQFSASKFQQENHAVKLSKEVVLHVVEYYKDNFFKRPCILSKKQHFEKLACFSKKHCFVNCSEISEKF